MPPTDGAFVQPVSLFLWGDRISAYSNHKVWQFKKTVLEVAYIEMEDTAKSADVGANKPYAAWTAKDNQNALTDTMCF